MTKSPAAQSPAAKSPAEHLKPGKSLNLAGVTDGAEALVVADFARAVASGANPPAISVAVKSIVAGGRWRRAPGASAASA